MKMVHCSDSDLEAYISNKKKSSRIAKHLLFCRKCWNKWNKFRWDLAKNKKGFKELQKYLGNSFKWYLDSSWELAKEWKRRNPKSLADIHCFYQSTENYLYNLTIWHESGDRYNLGRDFNKLDKKYDIETCIDYGCGIGTDGLRMTDLGKKVYFYDFDNPSMKFLKWRLKHRKIKDSKQIFVENIEKFPEVDLVWAIDVLEHMLNPYDIFKTFSDKIKVFAHISQFGDKQSGRHPFHFDFSEGLLNEELKKKGFRPDLDYEYLTVWVRK